ncbi:putative methyltransferase-domain-containing protein [Amylostereum chailletii]|nr:putative methyltransferase-domain-containing protein [Amylostereum chailletii]
MISPDDLALAPAPDHAPDDQEDPLAPLRLLPDPPPSIHHQHLHLHFPGPLALSLLVDAAPGCGGIAWPAGQVLATYLARRPDPALHRKSVLELGSGTGLVGLVAAAKGARVCITDQAQLLPTMTRNIALNAHAHAFPVAAAELNWGEPLPLPAHDDAATPIIPRPRALDLLLAADCVYLEPAFAPLVHTLCALVPPASPCEVLFCYKKRRKADKRFFALLKKHFTWEDVTDDPDRATYAREAISLLRLHRR